MDSPESDVSPLRPMPRPFNFDVRLSDESGDDEEENEQKPTKTPKKSAVIMLGDAAALFPGSDIQYFDGVHTHNNTIRHYQL